MGWIKNRIDAEYEKYYHLNMDWSGIAEAKIIATLKEQQVMRDEPED